MLIAMNSVRHVNFQYEMLDSDRRTFNCIQRFLWDIAFLSLGDVRCFWRRDSRPIGYSFIVCIPVNSRQVILFIQNSSKSGIRHTL